MPRNGSGSFSITNTYSPGQTITAAIVNANFSDVGAELTNSLPRDGQAAMTGQMKAAAGTAAAPSMTFGADTDTGFFPKAANSIGVACNGTEVAYFDENGLSQLGPGTTVVNVLRYIPVAEHAAIFAKTSTTDVTSYVQAAINAAATNPRGVVLFPAGRYRCTGDITVPCGWPGAVDIVGQGMWGNTEIEFSGASIVNGLHFDGGTYSKSGALRDIAIIGANNAVRGVTFSDLSQPYIERVLIWGFKGHGLYIDTCIMPTIVSILLLFNGSASLAQMRIRSRLVPNETSTTLTAFGLYIGQGQPGCVAGVDIDGVAAGFWSGGAIESSGVLIRIDNAPPTGGYSAGISFVGVDLENASTHFIEVGYGAGSISDGPRNITFDTVSCYASSTTTVVHCVKVKNSIGISFRSMNTTTSAGVSVSDYELEGTVQGIQISSERASYGRSYPYVRSGGTMVSHATPLVAFNSDFVQTVPATLGGSPKNISGTTPNGLWQTSQGGIPSFMAVNNASPTSMTKLLGCGVPFVEVTLNNQGAGATTIVHEAGGAGSNDGAFKTLTGSNVVMVDNRDYRFRYINGWKMWFQVA